MNKYLTDQELLDILKLNNKEFFSNLNKLQEKTVNNLCKEILELREENQELRKFKREILEQP